MRKSFVTRAVLFGAAFFVVGEVVRFPRYLRALCTKQRETLLAGLKWSFYKNLFDTPRYK
jgi:hypothetical protein